MINDSDFIVLDTRTANIVESFSDIENKRPTAGSGERRLYAGSILANNEENFMTFTAKDAISANKKKYDACESYCIFDKKNLIDYLYSVEPEYKNPKQESNGDLPSLYELRLEKVKSLPRYPRFTIHDQRGPKETDRLYIASTSPYWDLLREVALPHVSTLNIEKTLNSNTGEIIYVFLLYKTQNITVSYKKNSRQHDENQLINEISSQIELSDTEKKALILARKGQGKFRKNVLSIMTACPFTGITNQNLLRASHCIPWAECETASDRLDGYNGLALTPTYDLLFDQGFISFGLTGELLVSALLDNETRNALNLVPGKKYELPNANLRERFLRYHREKVLKQPLIN